MFSEVNIKYLHLLPLVLISAGCSDGSMKVSESIDQTCGVKPINPIILVSREKVAPMSMQGIGYWENTVVILQKGDLNNILSHLNNHDLYVKSVDADRNMKLEHTKPADFSKICRINIHSMELSYSLTYH